MCIRDRSCNVRHRLQIATRELGYDSGKYLQSECVADTALVLETDIIDRLTAGG